MQYHYKFKIITTENGYMIQDTKTKKELDLNNYEDVKQLNELLNDWYNIITDKWGL